MFDFTGKTVLITGASYGLGEGFAHAFASAVGGGLVVSVRQLRFKASPSARSLPNSSRVARRFARWSS